MPKNIRVRGKQYEIQAVALMPEQMSVGEGRPAPYDAVRHDVLQMAIGEAHVISLDSKKEVDSFRGAIQSVNPTNTGNVKHKLPKGVSVRTTYRRNGNSFLLYYQVVRAE